MCDSITLIAGCSTSAVGLFNLGGQTVQLERSRCSVFRGILTEARYKKASTIFCSQFDVPGWPEKLGDPIIADAICDRIVHDSYSVVIECKESMRKRKGVTET